MSFSSYIFKIHEHNNVYADNRFIIQTKALQSFQWHTEWCLLPSLESILFFLSYCPIKSLDSVFVNKPPTLMSIDSVILPLMVLIGLVIRGNCCPLSDGAFNDFLSLLRSKSRHRLEPRDRCDFKYHTEELQCWFWDRNSFSNKQRISSRLAYCVSLKSLLKPTNHFNSALRIINTAVKWFSWN